MNLYLIRHADAASVSSSSEDASRPLTDTGQQQSEALGKFMRDRKINLERIITSPLLRAEQTAEGIRRVWDTSPPPLAVCEYLAPGSKRKQLSRYLRDTGCQDVALIGHAPDLPAYAGWLIGGKKSHIDIAKAGVACISLDGRCRKGGGTLTWLITPDWFAANSHK
jgi:phosphohistidine phosphatase